jgi:hypothetical protein
MAIADGQKNKALLFGLVTGKELNQLSEQWNFV